MIKVECPHCQEQNMVDHNKYTDEYDDLYSVQQYEIFDLQCQRCFKKYSVDILISISLCDDPKE